MTQDTFN